MLSNIYENRIKPFIMITTAYFKSLHLAYKKKRNVYGYKSLGPTNDAKDIEAYTQSLDNVLKDKSIKNIAITGKYGSGKSSLLLTYFNRLENSVYNPIYISLASFNEAKVDSSDIDSNDDENDDQRSVNKYNDFQRSMNEYNQSIEKSILQQLLYHIDEKKVPLSSFKRLSKVSKIRIFTYAVLFCVSVFSIIVIFFPSSISLFEEQIESIAKSNPNMGIIADAVGIIAIGSVVWIVYYFLYLVIAKYNIGRIKIKDTEIEINGRNESLFNRFIDEILYFFQVSNHTVVVFEDLDRFKNPSIIFNKLRELNGLINNSNQIKRRIVFVYAMKDNFFKIPEERTKFFDFIIPVVPVVSNSNSNEILWRRLVNIYEKEFNEDLSIGKELVNDISPFISDNRTIDSILNEFCIHKKKFTGKGLNDGYLLSVIVYKNLYPQEYDKLLCNEGDVYELFQNKHTIILSSTDKIQMDINSLKERRKRILKDVFNNMKELKLAFLYTVQQKTTSYTIRNLKTKSASYTVEEFLDDSFDLDIIVELSKVYFSSGLNVDIEEFFNDFGSQTEFVQRLENLKTSKEKMIRKIDEERERREDEIKVLKDKSVVELIEEFDCNPLTKYLNNFEHFLIRRGYINEEYKEYITTFVAGELSENDLQYILSVKNRGIKPYTFELDNVDKIINDRLDRRDFKDYFFLNYQIVEHIILTKDEEKLSLIFQVFDKYCKESLEFLRGFISTTTYKEILIKRLFADSQNMINYIFNSYEGNIKLLNYWIKLYLLYSDKEFDFDTKDYIIDIINDYKNLDILFEDEDEELLTNELIKLGIKFKHIHLSNEKYEELVYGSKLIEANYIMLKRLLEYFHIDTSEYNNRSLTTIFESNNEMVKNFIIERFSEFINESYRITKNDSESQEVLLEILNHKEISKEDSKEVLGCLNLQINEVDKLPKHLILDSIMENKVSGSWKNLVQLINILDNVRLPEDTDEEKETRDPYIAEYYNNNSDILGRETNIVDGLIGNKLLINEYITDDAIIQTSHCYKEEISNIDSLTENIINEDRLKVLIDESLLNITKENYDYLVEEDSFELAARLIFNGFNEFVKTRDKYVINVDVQCEFIGLTENHVERKLDFINLLKFDETHDDALEFFVENVDMDNVYKYNEKLTDYLFSKLTDESCKVKALIAMVSHGVDTVSALKTCNTPFSNIGNKSKANASLDINPLNNRLAELLDEKNIIKSHRSLKNKIMLYNYRN